MTDNLFTMTDYELMELNQRHIRLGQPNAKVQEELSIRGFNIYDLPLVKHPPEVEEELRDKLNMPEIEPS